MSFTLPEGYWVLGEGQHPAWPIGGKALGLVRLLAAGCPIPPTVVVSGTTAEAVSRDAKLDPGILEMIAKVTGGGSLAIRSSFALEDGRDRSYAGAFRSLLRVPIRADSIEEAIASVYASYEPDDASSTGGGAIQSALNKPIIIQKFIAGSCGGVAFSSATRWDGRDGVLLEIADGGPEDVVRGAGQLARVFFDTDGEVWLSGNLNQGITIANVEAVKSMIVDASVGSGQDVDIEWILEKDGDLGEARVWLLQGRPISRPVVLRRRRSGRGLPVSSGVFDGPAHSVDDSNVSEFVGGIMVAEITETAFLPAMMRAQAIVTEAGGLLSHAAIVAREMSIPCVVGVPEAVRLFGGRPEVRIDGDRGLVTVGGAEDLDVERESAESQYDEDSSFCIEEWFSIVIPGDGGTLVVEPSLKGLIIHAPLESRPIESVIRSLVWRIAGPINDVTFGNDKFVWMEEWRRMRTLDIVRALLSLGRLSGTEVNTRGLAQFYEIIRATYVAIASRCADLGNDSQTLQARLAAGELCQALNLLAVAVIPQGYALRSLQEEAWRRGGTLEGLLRYQKDAEGLSLYGPDLISYVELLSEERNVSYEFMSKTVRGAAEYFRLRDELILAEPFLGDVGALYRDQEFREFIGSITVAVMSAYGMVGRGA